MKLAAYDIKKTYEMCSATDNPSNLRNELIMLSLTVGTIEARIQRKRALAKFKEVDKNAKEENFVFYGLISLMASFNKWNNGQK